MQMASTGLSKSYLLSSTRQLNHHFRCFHLDFRYHILFFLVMAHPCQWAIEPAAAAPQAHLLQLRKKNEINLHKINSNKEQNAYVFSHYQIAQPDMRCRYFRAVSSQMIHRINQTAENHWV